MKAMNTATLPILPSPWIETTEESFQYSMDCLPPIMVNGLKAFMVSEPLRHDLDTGRPVYTGFAEVKGKDGALKHYTCDATVAQFKEHYIELIKALG